MIRQLMLSIGLLASLSLNAQEKRELDWQELKKSVKTTDVMKPVRFGEFTIFQISDINKFLYKVEIAGSVFELQTPMPSELQALFRLTPTELQKTMSNRNAEEAVNKVNTAKELMMDRKGGLSERAAALTPIEDDLSKSLSKLLVKCEKYLALVKSLSADIFTLKRTRSELISIAQFDIPHSEITGKVAAVNWPMPDLRNDYFESKALYHEVEVLYEASLNYAKRAGEEAKRLNALTAEAMAGTVRDIEESGELIEKADELIDEEALLGMLADVDFLYSELNNRSNFRVIAPPVQMDGDIVTYEVSIVPTTTRSLAPYRNPMQFKFDVPAFGGTKVDFSVGPTFSFGSGSKHEVFFLEETGIDEVALRQRSNNNVISPGIAAFMHVYKRSGKPATWGGLLGVGAGFQSFEDINPSIYLGVSLVLGKMQKVIIGTGVSFLKVDRLKARQYEVDKVYAISKINLSDVTEKIYKASPFFSFSYSLASRTRN